MKVQIKTNYHNIVSYSPNCNFKVLILIHKIIIITCTLLNAPSKSELFCNAPSKLELFHLSHHPFLSTKVYPKAVS